MDVLLQTEERSNIMLFKVTSHLQRPRESFIWQKSQTFYLRFPKKIKIFKILRFFLLY